MCHLGAGAKALLESLEGGPRQRPCWSRWKGVEAKALLESLEGGPRQRPYWSHWKGVRGKGPAGVTGRGSEAKALLESLGRGSGEGWSLKLEDAQELKAPQPPCCCWPSIW